LDGFSLLDFFFSTIIHGFDTRGLFITCMYSILSTTYFIHAFGEFLLGNYKSADDGPLHWMAFVYWISSFLLIGHGFDSRGLFIICMYSILSTTHFIHAFGEFRLEVFKSVGKGPL